MKTNFKSIIIYYYNELTVKFEWEILILHILVTIIIPHIMTNNVVLGKWLINEIIFLIKTIINMKIANIEL